MTIAQMMLGMEWLVPFYFFYALSAITVIVDLFLFILVVKWRDNQWFWGMTSVFAIGSIICLLMVNDGALKDRVIELITLDRFWIFYGPLFSLLALSVWFHKIFPANPDHNRGQSDAVG